MMSLLVYFCAVLFFPRDFLDEIWDFNESVSEGLPTYFYAPNSVRPSVRLSVRNTFWQLRKSRTPCARILKFYMWHVHEK